MKKIGLLLAMAFLFFSTAAIAFDQTEFDGTIGLRPPIGHQYVLMAGASLLKKAPVDMLFSFYIYNRGVSGFSSKDMYVYRELIFVGEPDMIFLSNFCGNDVLQGFSLTTTQKYLVLLARWLREKYPDTPIFIESVTPTRNLFFKNSIVLKNDFIENTICPMFDMIYIDTFTSLVDQKGLLAVEYSAHDGMNLSSDGYTYWAMEVNTWIRGIILDKFPGWEGKL